MENACKLLKKICRKEYPLWLYGKFISTFQCYWDNTFEASEIIENLWVGNLSSATNKEELEKINIDTIIVSAIGVRELFPENFNYISVPFRDVEDEPILDKIIPLLPQIRELLEQHKPVFVHCMMGASRSVTIVACYLMKYHNMPSDKVIEFMKSKRNAVDPNKGYLDALVEYEKLVLTLQNIDNVK